MRMHKAVVAIVFLGFAIGAANCGGSTQSSSGAESTGPDSGTFVPAKKIPADTCDAGSNVPPDTRSGASCSSTRPPGDFQGSDAGACSPTATFCCQDSDCTAGKNGRCQNYIDVGHTCTYDACTSDADCRAGTVCDCEGSGNACIPGNCKSDADCGAGFTCAATYDQICGERDGIQGYYCHSAKDDCGSQCDCACTFSNTADKWICTTAILSCTG
jgi:hypothetical protein